MIQHGHVSFNSSNSSILLELLKNTCPTFNHRYSMLQGQRLSRRPVLYQLRSRSRRQQYQQFWLLTEPTGVARNVSGARWKSRLKAESTGKRWWGMSQLVSLEECCKLPQRGLGQVHFGRTESPENTAIVATNVV